jgi:periplasmic copper chaperone A
MRAPVAYALLTFAAAGLSPMARAAAPAVKEAWDGSKPRASGAWVRLNPVPGRPSAGYLVVDGGGQPDRLVGASAPGARIEMHSMSMDGGIMKMAKLDGLAVPAGSKVSFAPGGNHLMIYGLTGGVKTLPITLSGAKVVAVAEVRAAGAEPAKAMDHMAH